MNCVKCGREIPEDQVFCEICLAEMERYPVKPDTAIHIPSRAPEVEVKKSRFKRRRIPTPEEMVPRLKKKLRRTRWILAVVLLICGGLSMALGQMVLELDWQRLVGQNYKITGIRPLKNQEANFTSLTTEPTEVETEETPVVHNEWEELEIEQAPVEAETEPATESVTETPTEAPTEEPTEPITEPVTEVPTEEATEPATEAPTEVTEEVTEPEATAAAETEATEPEEQPAVFSDEPTEEPA